MHRVSFRRAAVGAGLTGLLVAVAVAAALRSDGVTAAKVAAAPAAHVHFGSAEHEHFVPDPAAPHSFTLPHIGLPAQGQASPSAFVGGAFRGTSVPAGFVGVPANVAAAYGGPPLTLRVTYVGRQAAEPTVGADSDNDAFFAAGTFDSTPIGGAARTLIMRSTDDNLTWEAKSPAITSTISDPQASLDPYVYVDADTDRVYSGDLAGAGIQFMWTDSKGEPTTTAPTGWTRGNPVPADVPVDHQTFYTAVPPAPLLPTPAYPKYMYFCTNRVAEVGCSRSVDGGVNFVSAGQPPYLGVEGTTICGGLHGHLTADKEGRIFLPKAHCGQLGLADDPPPQIAISANAGATWTRGNLGTVADHLRVPHHEVSAAVDSANNVYVVWWDTENNLPYLSHSTDHGATWSTPRMIAPPGVLEVNFPTIAAGAAGRIAITFPGTTATGTSRPWNSYVVVSTDALSADPLFVWSTANDPADPVHRGTCEGRCSGMYDFLDINATPPAGAFSPGMVKTFWATLADDCITACITGTANNRSPGDGAAIMQTGGPSLWPPPTAVTVTSFRAKATSRGVDLRWRTASETGTFGYDVWRVAGKTSVKVNRAPIVAKAAGRAGGASYRLVDRGARAGASYTYRLRAVNVDGHRSWRASTTVTVPR